MTPDQEARFFARMQSMFDTHRQASEKRHQDAITSIRKDLASAFPEGDLHGHCAYHEDVMEQVTARKEFWIKMRYELYRYGLFIFILLALAQLAHSFGIDFWKWWDRIK